MSQKLKCHIIWYVTKIETSKTETSSENKYHKNLKVTKTEMSQKHKCHKEVNITKIEI